MIQLNKDIPRWRAFKPGRGILFITATLLVISSQLMAGVLVAPTLVILSESNRTGRLILQNPTDKPQEVSIGFAFGYPTSDSLGNVSIQLSDSGVVDQRSAAEWIRAFPRQMVLPPGAEQIVRFIASPPAGLTDGEYWARIMVRSTESDPEISSVGEGEIGARLKMVVQSAISLKYRQGTLTSKIDIPYSSATLVDTMVVTILDMVNQGNVSYLGKLKCRLLDADRKEVSSFETNVAIYYDLRRRIELPITSGEFKPPYQVEMIVSTRGRTDVALVDIIPGNEVAFVMPVE